MSISGKIFGSAAGFAIGGPLGALMGIAAGHAYDHFRDEQREADGGEPSLAKQTAFAIAVIALCAKMAKVDGLVSRAEIDAFKEVLHIAPGEEAHVRMVFDLARRDARGYEPYAKQAARLFRENPAVLEHLLAGLFHIAEADGTVGTAEIDYLKGVATIFGLDDDRFEQVRTAHLGTDPGDPYRVLGVVRSAPDDEIRAARRRLLREHHPDRLVAQGMPEDFIRVATRRVAAINAAYDLIREQRGFA